MSAKQCLRCGHEWEARMLQSPKACPACKSYKWNVHRDIKSGTPMADVFPDGILAQIDGDGKVTILTEPVIPDPTERKIVPIDET
jgi:hypothetical protein